MERRDTFTAAIWLAAIVVIAVYLGHDLVTTPVAIETPAVAITEPQAKAPAAPVDQFKTEVEPDSVYIYTFNPAFSNARVVIMNRAGQRASAALPPVGNIP